MRAAAHLDVRCARGALAGVEPSLCAPEDVTFKALHTGTVLGHAISVEESGKHRSITFVVGVRTDSSSNDVAVIAAREAHGARSATNASSRCTGVRPGHTTCGKWLTGVTNDLPAQPGADTTHMLVVGRTFGI